MKTKTVLKSTGLYQTLVIVFLVVAALGLRAQTYSFTPCGATGLNGPTQIQVNNAYTGLNTLTGLVTISTQQGVQLWTVPGGGNYKIEAIAARGGNTSFGAGGKGAYMSGEFNLTGGQVLKIVVGQIGSQTSDNTGAGGGGGTYVADNSNTPLIVAGGGGGNGTSFVSPTEIDGSLTVAKQGHSGGGCAGTGANGGTNCGTMGGSCGGGFLTDGANSPNRPSIGGKAFVNGSAGGINESNVGSGGFGGGAGGGTSCGYGGGGGGYAGGGGGGWATQCGGNGGGGGSFNSGTSQSSQVAYSSGDGMVIITRLCAVTMTASKNPICSGESVALTTDAVSNIVWAHNGSTLPIVNVSPSTNTTYKVIGQAASGCTTEVALNVTVNPSPVMSAVVVPSVLCVGNTATLSASGAKSYTWTSLSVNGPTATANPGISTGFAYSGSNNYNCVTSGTAMVNVNTNTLGISSNTSVCLGNSVWIEAFNALTYTWSTGNNFASTPVSPVSNTNYIANGTDIHNCVLTNVVAVTVNQKPNVTAGASKTSICRGEQITLNGGGASTYTWSSGAGAGQSVTQVLPVETVYSYIVSGTDGNGCTNTATVVVIASKCTGIDKLSASELNSRIYPNPACNAVTIELSSGSRHTIDVVDLTGRTVLSAETADSSIQLNLGSLSNGVYYFKVNSAEGTETIKVIKNN